MPSQAFIDFQEARLASTPALAHTRLANGKLDLLSLPNNVLGNIFTRCLAASDPKLQKAFKSPHGIASTKCSPPCPPPNLLYVNKRVHVLAQEAWFTSGFSHIYLNSWNELPAGVLAQRHKMRILCITMDIRRGIPGSDEGLLRATEFCAKIRMLLGRMPHVLALVLHVWHGRGASEPVSRIIMNAFAGFKVSCINVFSCVNREDCMRVRPENIMPGALSPWYLRYFLGELLDRDPASFPSFYKVRIKEGRNIVMSMGSGARDLAMDAELREEDRVGGEAKRRPSVGDVPAAATTPPST